jgi:Fe-S cluster assembly protein SufB
MVLKKNMSKYTEDDLKIELENKEYEYRIWAGAETFLWFKRDIVRAISHKKGEPQWMTDWRGFRLLGNK